MKKYLCMLAALLLCCSIAHAELPALTLPPQSASQMPITLVTPTPTPLPAGVEFSCEAFIVYLPAGMELLDSAALAGYEAAAQANYPDAAATQLAAIDPARSAALSFSLARSTQSPIEAAREAAAAILGSADSAVECRFGLNAGAGFACSVEETTYRFYYFSNGSELLLVSACGLDETEISTMLSTLDF